MSVSVASGFRRVLHTRLTWSAVVLAALLAVLAVPSLSSTADAGTWQSGVFRNSCDAPAVQQFADWRGKSVPRVVQFLNKGDWSDIEGPDYLMTCWSGRGKLVTWSVPLLPDNDGTVQQGADGSYNSHFKTLARRLVDAGQGNATLRLGWEMNGSWFRWSAAKDPAAFRRYWVQVVNAMRSVNGQSFTFDWSPNLGQGTAGFDPSSAYPGDQYVDYVGASVYDKKWQDPNATPQDRWDQLLNQPYGLSWQASFARAHGKPMSYPEWGLVAPNKEVGGGGDDPYFVQQFYDWVSTHNVAYESYFEVNHSASMRHSMMNGADTGPLFPNAAWKYRQLFGTKGDVAPAATTSRSATLRYSKSEDRSWPHPLDGAKLAGWAYVFADVTGNADSVSFYLDDPNRTRKPLSVEYHEPYDMLGGTPEKAEPLLLGDLANGRHQVTAVVRWTGGGSSTVTVTFTK